MVELTHTQAEEELSAYLDGELTQEQQQALEQHLAGCPICRELLEQLRRTCSAVAGLQQARAPQDFVHKVQRRIENRSRGRCFRGKGGVERSFLGILVLVMLLVTMVLALAALSIFILDDAGQAPGTSAAGKGSLGGAAMHGRAAGSGTEGGPGRAAGSGAEGGPGATASPGSGGTPEEVPAPAATVAPAASAAPAARVPPARTPSAATPSPGVEGATP
ncbi:MAG: hypothetical protein FJ125_17460 [Deltaproteobacteria bacterium]|nr:hypothetical protein [Deltaproteobacteria bacterium]